MIGFIKSYKNNFVPIRVTINTAIGVILKRVTVTLTRYSETDSLLREVLEHAVAQQGVEGEVLLIEQKPDSEIKETDYVGSALPLRIVRAQVSGLSEARNLSLVSSENDLILFLDADAIAAPDWAAALANALGKSGVAVAGSRIVPRWTGSEPWFARARVVKDQYSLLDLGKGSKPYPRVVGAAFGVDRSKTTSLRFDQALGRRGGKLFGGEESDFCNRVIAGGMTVVYQGAACVEHVVAPERMRLKWLLKRLIYAGQGRASLGGRPSPSQAPGLIDWLTLPVTLPPYALGWIWGKVQSRAERG